MLIISFVLIFLFISVFSENTCHFDVKLQQKLHNEGFHRNLTYKVIFNNKYGDVDQYERCSICIDQTLPAGVYYNPDELGDFRRMYKLSALPKNRVNVELLADQAQPTSVFIFGNVDNRMTHLWLPVHARYHQAAMGGKVHNVILPPHLYIHCPHIDLQHCVSSPLVSFNCNGYTKDVCTWTQIFYEPVQKTLLFDVPIGDTSHYNIVTYGTLCVVITLSLFLLSTLHQYKMAAVKKKT